jgi:hypothetical protein
LSTDFAMKSSTGADESSSDSWWNLWPLAFLSGAVLPERESVADITRHSAALRAAHGEN